jgi:hypothetical protein
MVVQAVGTVLGEDHDVEDIAVHAVAEREVDDAVFAAEGDSRLGALGSQGGETCAFAARKDDRFYSHKCLLDPYIRIVDVVCEGKL